MIPEFFKMLSEVKRGARHNSCRRANTCMNDMTHIERFGSDDFLWLTSQSSYSQLRSTSVRALTSMFLYTPLLTISIGSQLLKIFQPFAGPQPERYEFPSPHFQPAKASRSTRRTPLPSTASWPPLPSGEELHVALGFSEVSITTLAHSSSSQIAGATKLRRSRRILVRIVTKNVRYLNPSSV